MKKVILIEDRIYRQKTLLEERTNKLNLYPFLTNINGGEEFEQLRNKFNKNDFSTIDKFNTVMIHRSAFKADIRNSLIEYLRERKISAVFFSGGITGSQLSTDGGFDFLLINPREFYGDNLFLFLDNNAENILQLAFGKRWELSLLIDTVDSLNLLEKSFQKKPFVIFETDIQLNQWIKETYFKEYLNDENSLITVEGVKNIIQDINKRIKDLI